MTKIVLLWHHLEPVGVCVFTTPMPGLRQRARFFGTNSNLHGEALAGLTKQLWVLARVVLHPTYRGAGVAAAFVRAACKLCPVLWIEALAVMGRANPFFEKAGFVRVGITRKKGRGLEPVYYVLDNRINQIYASAAVADNS